MKTSDESDSSTSIFKDALVGLAVEFWRLHRLINSAMQKQDLSEQRRLDSHLLWIRRKIEESLKLANLRIINVEGQRYDPGMAVTVVSSKTFEQEDVLFVDKMIEPIIMEGDYLVKSGTITLKKVKND